MLNTVELNATCPCYGSMYSRKQAYALMIVIMMLGNVYIFPLYRSLNMGEIIAILFFPIFVPSITKLKFKQEHKILALFLLYALIVSLLMCMMLDGNISKVTVRLLRDFFYYAVLMVGARFFDIKLFRKAVVSFCLILGAFLIMQVVIWRIFGYLIPGLLMGAYVNDAYYKGADLYSFAIEYAKVGGYLKPMGFLCEPAHCAQCFFVALILLLFDEEKKREDIVKAGFISLGMALTMSTSAFLYLFFVWGIWCFKEGRKRLRELFLIAFAVILSAPLFITSNRIDKIVVVVQRFTNSIFGKGIISNSAQLRMFKGFATFNVLPFPLKLFGIGFGNYSAIVSTILRKTSIEMVGSEYMNTISYLLISSGFIGMGLFGLFLFRKYKKGCTLRRVMILGMVFACMGASVYSGPIWIWMMLIVLYSNERIGIPDGRCDSSKLC